MASNSASAKYRDNGGPSGQRRKPHPRRTPPAESASLPAQMKQQIAQKDSQTEQAQDPSKQKSAQTKQQVKQQETQDSNGSDESATKWFDKANKNGPQGQRESPSTDGEPPFFLSNQKAYFPNNFVSSGSDDELFGVEHRDDSENEDLRGVIDDLTVENKRLKLLLKSTRSRPSPSTSDAQDRLFDLRVHGLSIDKKRELENLLLNFASSVHVDSNTASASSARSAPRHAASDGSSSVNPNQTRAKSGQLPTDSGYGSNSTSGGMTSNNASHGTLPAPLVQPKNRNKNVQTYLHDIPNTLLPRHSPYMSKRAKMALVVRRLENLFTGRNAAPGDHSQPMQQQEVSQSAARAEDHLQRLGIEGHREAHMLPQDSRVNLDAYDRQNPSPPKKKAKRTHETLDRLQAETQSANASPATSPLEQRPTRPLDLDIHRAQVAAENIQYLRHLGISSPRTMQGPGKESPWIYLNLLISMAQLHSINVTPAFIRQAIRKLSTKFELSQDGHKVRWTGGTEGTVFSKEEERDMELPNPSPAESHEEGGHSSKRSKTNSSSNALISEEPSSEDKTASGLQSSSNATKQQVSTGATSVLPTDISARSKATGTPFDYKPLFYKGKRYSPAASYLESSESSYSNSNDSSGLVHALSKSNLNQRRNSDEGMITFYQNPYFCTDLSADNAPVNWIQQRAALPWDTLGLTRECVEESPLRHHDACYYAPQFAPKPIQADHVDAHVNLGLSPLGDCGEVEPMPKELPVCGIGGVTPDDNFALDVKIGRTKVNPRHDKKPIVVPFTGSRKRKRYAYELDECTKFELQASKLPPPSYVFFTSSASSADPDMTDDSDSDTSSEALDLNPPPPAFLNQWSTESDDDDDDDDTSSVDMLELARAAAPDQVAAQEREYLLHQNVGRRLEGSLAATVGASRTSSSAGDALSMADNAEIASDVDMDGSEDESHDADA